MQLKLKEPLEMMKDIYSYLNKIEKHLKNDQFYMEFLRLLSNVKSDPLNVIIQASGMLKGDQELLNELFTYVPQKFKMKEQCRKRKAEPENEEKSKKLKASPLKNVLQAL